MKPQRSLAAALVAAATLAVPVPALTTTAGADGHQPDDLVFGIAMPSGPFAVQPGVPFPVSVVPPTGYSTDQFVYEWSKSDDGFCTAPDIAADDQSDPASFTMTCDYPTWPGPFAVRLDPYWIPGDSQVAAPAGRSITRHFDVARPAPFATLTSAVGAPGQPTRVSGRLTLPDGTPKAGYPVTLELSEPGHPWWTAQHGTTNDRGKVSFAVYVPNAWDARLLALSPNESEASGAMSPEVRVKVPVRALIEARPGGGRVSVLVRRYNGDPVRGARVTLHRRPAAGGSWTRVTRERTDETGIAYLAVTWRRPTELRARVAETSGRATATSKILRVG